MIHLIFIISIYNIFPSSAGHDLVEVSSVSDNEILFIYENKLIVIKYISLSETGGCKVAAQLLNLFQYYYEDIFLKLDKNVDPTYSLCDIFKYH